MEDNQWHAILKVDFGLEFLEGELGVEVFATKELVLLLD